MTPASEIHPYNVGLVHMSVCAPVEATREEIEAVANARHPTGIASRWAVSLPALQRATAGRVRW